MPKSEHTTKLDEQYEKEYFQSINAQYQKEDQDDMMRDLIGDPNIE